jgi:hypothetical protein
VAVGLAYNPEGAWTWSHGRREHRQGIEYWSFGELQEASTGITLQYRNSVDPRTLAEYCSAETNYLILPNEEFDSQTRQVKKEDQDRDKQVDGLSIESTGDSLGSSELDEHPF